ncbi:MAG: DUF3127 domain-containing protein [Ferruginibacter sp.]|nr:DUF3127 domain-containing protein [Ferruginibacter sp.]
MEITGKIKMVGEAINVGSGSFLKRELVITTDEQYPQHILVQFVQDKCDLLNNYKVGEDVKVSINLRGKEWVDPQGVTKYFNAIQGWRVEKTNAQPQNISESAVDQYETKYTAMKIDGHEEDDLPF